MRQSRKLHGPAITLYMSLGNKDVSVDLAAAVKTNLLIQTWHGWPRAGARWPSAEKVERIRQIPLTEVAKKDFYWMFSFTGNTVQNTFSMHVYMISLCKMLAV